MHLTNKQYPLLLLLSLLFVLANCDKFPAPAEPVCNNDCLFAMTEASGTMIKMACFNRYAIQAHHPETDSVFIYGLPDELNSKFKVEGKNVTFSGTFRTNTLTPTFPDPSFSPEHIYQMKITEIR